MNRKIPSRFPNTRWSLIGRAAASDEFTQMKAMEELLIAYTPALKSFLVESRRIPKELADDLLHDFVLNKVLTRRLVQHANQGKGKFRNYVLKALNNFVNTKLSRERKIHEKQVEVDETALPDPASLDEIACFDEKWVQQVVRDSLQSMESELQSNGRTDLWEIFRLRVVEPMLNGSEPAGYNEIVRRFDIQTPRQAINLLATAKRCFIRHLRETVGRYTGDKEKIDNEIEDLRQIVGR